MFTNVIHCLLRDQGNLNFTNSHNSNHFLALYWYNINEMNIRMFVHSVFIFSPRYIRYCFAHFWARLKSSKYLQQKHGIMAVKMKTINNLIWQKLVPTYRHDINKFPKIELKKYFDLKARHTYRQVYTVPVLLQMTLYKRKIYTNQANIFLLSVLRDNFFKNWVGGAKKNKNKSMFIPESMKKIKIKVIFIIISFIIFFEELEDS